MKKIPLHSIKVQSDAPPQAGSFSMRSLGGLSRGGEMAQSLHRHDHYFILFVQKGGGQHAIDFKNHKIKDGVLFLIKPGSVHQLRLKAGTSGYVLQFSPDFYFTRQGGANLLRAVHHLSCCRFASAGLKRLETLFEAMYLEHQEKKPEYNEAIKARLDLLFIEMARNSGAAAKDAGAGWTYAMQKAVEFAELLEKEIRSYKKVSQYAQLMGMSTQQLNAITRKTSGRSCSALISEQVLLEAKRCLLATTSQVSQIAYHLGYEDVSYFIRFFKKHTGSTPELFRKRFK